MQMIKAQEIAFKDKDRAVDVMRDLVEEGYVVMLSAEEHLYIVNYIWSPSWADRNDVTFMSNCDFEDLLFNEE